MIRFLLFVQATVLFMFCQPTKIAEAGISSPAILPGAYQTEEYLSILQGKKIGLCVNHTSMIEDTHLVDSLLSLGQNVTKIFTPEHGYKGTADAGEKVEDDEVGTLEIISLYGQNKKPTPQQLAGIELMIFDIQDVGTRFYTYISTMHYVMEACAENNIPLLILDRPNPNDFVDGPVLDTAFRSFVGMHKIPILHGLTVGELAQMINGQSWLKDSLACALNIIPVRNWQHGDPYQLPVNPSPNLPNQQAVHWYPTLCFFEGTYVSVGRGTTFPFQLVGAPNFPDSTFTFTPISGPGAKYPKFQDERCFGMDLRSSIAPRQIDISLIKDVYSKSDTAKFFQPYFNTLAGTDVFKNQILADISESDIRKSWSSDIENYLSIRGKYLLYPEKRFGVSDK